MQEETLKRRVLDDFKSLKYMLELLIIVSNLFDHEFDVMCPFVGTVKELMTNFYFWVRGNYSKNFKIIFATSESSNSWKVSSAFIFLINFFIILLKFFH